MGLYQSRFPKGKPWSRISGEKRNKKEEKRGKEEKREREREGRTKIRMNDKSHELLAKV
jgi:hypothetical protein